jgi:DNA-binding NarL/FixJ family response regulator
MRRLTRRELEIAELVARGWGDHEIAVELRISVRTVQSHLDRVAFKLDAEASPHRRRRVIREWIERRSAAI